VLYRRYVFYDCSPEGESGRSVESLGDATDDRRHQEAPFHHEIPFKLSRDEHIDNAKHGNPAEGTPDETENEGEAPNQGC
jgi:hypothetical protein